MVYTGKDAANRLTIAAYKKKGLGLEDLLRKVSPKMADARMLFCYFAGSVGFPTREIGTYLGIQQAAVSNAARKGEQIAKKLNIKIM